MISRDQLLETIISLMKQKFGFQIDFDKPNFETWLAETLSVLDENQLMYLSLLMNESFLTTALLPSTIKKFATDYGYQYRNVTPAHGDLDIYIAIDNTTNIDAVIDYNTEFVDPTGITYLPKYKVYVTFNKYTNTANIVAYDIVGNKIILPYDFQIISQDSRNMNALHFKLPVIQTKRKVYSFVVTTDDTLNYKFPVYHIDKSDSPLSDIHVFISGTPAIRVNFLFELKKDVYSFVLQESPSGYDIILGNNLIGLGPKPGDVIVVEAFFSLGSKGNVYADSLQLATPIINQVNQSPLNIVVSHPDITNGKDAESPNDIRLNTIAYLHTNDRLVTEKDFELLTRSNDIPFNEIKAIFTESDVHVNEVVLFGMFVDNSNNPIPSTTGMIKTTKDRIPQGQIVYQNDLTKNEFSFTKSTSNALEFKLPFEIVINTDTMIPIAYFYPVKTSIPFKIIQEAYYSVDNQSYVKLKNVELHYENGKQFMRLKLYLHVLNFQNIKSNFRFEILLSQNNRSYTLSNVLDYRYDSLSHNLDVDIEIPNNLQDLLTTASVSIYYKYADEQQFQKLSYSELQPFKLKYNVSNYVPLKLMWKQINQSTIEYTILGVPAISDDNYLTSLYTTGIDFIRSKKMVTNKVALSFAKTVGRIMTASLSVHPLNEINDNEVDLPVPLEINLTVHTTMPSESIEQEVEKFIRDQLKPSFDTNIIISKIVQLIRDKFDYVRDVEVYVIDKNGHKLEKNIAIQYDMKHIPKDKILTFVPEAISVNPTINVKYV